MLYASQVCNAVFVIAVSKFNTIICSYYNTYRHTQQNREITLSFKIPQAPRLGTASTIIKQEVIKRANLYTKA